MQFVRCNACPAHGQCDEHGSCLNTVVIMRTQERMRVAGASDLKYYDAIASNYTKNAAPAPAQPMTTCQAEGFAAPKAGTSTETIFRACAELWHASGFSEDKGVLDSIRQKVAESLVTQGLNINTVKTQANRWYHHRKQFVI